MCLIDSWLYKSIYFNSYLSEKVLSQDPVLIIVRPTFLKLHLNIRSNNNIQIYTALCTVMEFSFRVLRIVSVTMLISLLFKSG